MGVQENVVNVGFTHDDEFRLGKWGYPVVGHH